MAVGLWGRLNLRWQTAFAVLLPSTAIALFASAYFPSRLNRQAAEALESKAVAIGAMATAQIAPSLAFYKDGLASVDELDKVFDGMKASGDVEYVGFFWLDG